MREVKGSFSVSDRPPASVGVNRVVSDQSHFEVEQQNLTVSRDTAITGIVTVGTLGGGAAASLFGRGTQTVAAASGLTTRQVVTQNMILGGTEAGLESTARAVDNVQSGSQSIPQATGQVLRDSTLGAATGGVLGGSLHHLGRRLGRGGKEVADAVDPDALRVDGPELDQILNAPPIEESLRRRSIDELPGGQRTTSAYDPNPFSQANASEEAVLAGVGLDSPPSQLGAAVDGPSYNPGHPPEIGDMPGKSDIGDHLGNNIEGPQANALRERLERFRNKTPEQKAREAEIAAQKRQHNEQAALERTRKQVQEAVSIKVDEPTRRAYQLSRAENAQKAGVRAEEAFNRALNDAGIENFNFETRFNQLRQEWAVLRDAEPPFGEAVIGLEDYVDSFITLSDGSKLPVDVKASMEIVTKQLVRQDNYLRNVPLIIGTEAEFNRLSRQQVHELLRRTAEDGVGVAADVLANRPTALPDAISNLRQRLQSLPLYTPRWAEAVLDVSYRAQIYRNTADMYQRLSRIASRSR